MLCDAAQKLLLTALMIGLSLGVGACSSYIQTGSRTNDIPDVTKVSSNGIEDDGSVNPSEPIEVTPPDGIAPVVDIPDVMAPNNLERCMSSDHCKQEWREPLFVAPVTEFEDPLLQAFKPASEIYERTIYIETGSQSELLGKGTAAEPYIVPRGDVDALMKSLTEPINTSNRPSTNVRTRVIFGKGVFLTRGMIHHGLKHDLVWFVPSRWTLEGSGDQESVFTFNDLHFLPARQYMHANLLMGYSPSGAEKAQEQIIRNIKFVGQFSRYAAPYRRANVHIRLHGVEIYGDRSGLESLRFEDFGSTQDESFVAMVAGSQYRSWPQGTSFGPAWITDCLYENTIDPLNASQVSVFGISGSGDQPASNPNRVDYFMKNAVMTRNRVIIKALADGRAGEAKTNLVQGFSFYRVDGAVVAYNETLNATIGYYSDWWHQKNFIIRNNRFLNTANGIILNNDQYPSFQQENIKIYDNLITLEPYRDGARAGIRIRRSSFDPEPFAYYDAGEKSRLTSDIDIRGNFITYHRVPTSQETVKYSALIQEVKGLTIVGNIFDAALLPMYLKPIERRDASGKLVATYVNENVTIADNRSRNLGGDEAFCRDPGNIRNLTMTLFSDVEPLVSVIQEEARHYCSLEHVGLFPDRIPLVSAREGQWKYGIRCLPVMCLGAL